MSVSNPLLRRDLLIVLGLLVIMVLVPAFVGSRYLLGQLILFFIYACVVTQWNLVFGVAGIMSLGHVAVFATGAYVTAILSLYLPIPFAIAVIGGAVAAIVLSFLLGLATLRMRGEYVAIVTLAIAVVLYSAVTTDVSCFRTVNQICYNFTGGTRGLVRYGDFGWAKMFGPQFSRLADYYLALIVLFLGFCFALMLIHGPFGLAFRALRDNELYARARGIDLRKYQLLVFTFAGGVAGLAGGVFAGYSRSIGPSLLQTDLMLFLLSMMIVGGRGATWAPLLGTAALMLVDEILKPYGSWRTTGLSAITILVIVAYPGGLAAAIDVAWQRLRALAGRSRETEQALGEGVS